jgi:hypothetical protein
MGVSPLDLTRLGEGYALFVNSLNHPTNSCNAVVAAEAAMMGKEHFVEEFGVPSYTMSTGGSGGAYTSLQISDAYPGIFDGVTVSATFPDALSIALAGLDAHLLTHYFGTPAAATLTDAQKLAITGYQSIKAFVDAANQSQRTDPVPNRADVEGYQSARWNAVVPQDLRYDPVKNPEGRASHRLRRRPQRLRRQCEDRCRASSVRQRRRPVRAERPQQRRHHGAAVPGSQRKGRRLRPGRELHDGPRGR